MNITIEKITVNKNGKISTKWFLRIDDGQQIVEHPSNEKECWNAELSAARANWKSSIVKSEITNNSIHTVACWRPA